MQGIGEAFQRRVGKKGQFKECKFINSPFLNNFNSVFQGDESFSKDKISHRYKHI